MTSDRQVAANRRNAARSTGPRTASGKLRSRRNAYRHGLTAETVICSLEEPAKYQAFEAGLFRDYAPESGVERELVARLASLLWRLRRATLIETGLFEMQGGMLQRHRDQISHEATHPTLQVFYRFLHEPHSPMSDEPPPRQPDQTTIPTSPLEPIMDASSGVRCKIDTASVYSRLCRNNTATMKRLGRYETALWRQVAQMLLILETSRSNRSRFSFWSAQSLDRQAPQSSRARRR